MSLRDRIRSRNAHVVVVGAGYVGLPLATQMAKAGLRTTAYDRSRSRVDLLNRGGSYIADVSSALVEELVGAGKLDASVDPDVLERADAVIVCVPTPLNKTRDPDNSLILEAIDVLLPRMRRPMLIVLESTTFPGFTREVLLPKLRGNGREPDRDFFLAYSPERVDPGNKKFLTQNTPKVMGAISPESLEMARSLYDCFIEKVVPVSSTDSAEMVKLLENTFRAVNIGLVNEVAIMCGRLGLDVWEVIEAAATKPFGYMPFLPGPGIGGHCIPIDPLYLSWKLKTLRYDARFIALADEINSAMPEIVVMRAADALKERKKAMRGAKVLVVGVTYKRDVEDVRESPALDIIAILRRRGAQVAYSDPFVPTLRLGELELAHVPLSEAGGYDCAVIATDHTSVDYAQLLEVAQLVVDTRNATRSTRGAFPGKVVSL